MTRPTPQQCPTEIAAVVKAQYRAALSMMQQAIQQCPDSLWLSGAGHDAPYWRIAFHGLFYTHFYLQKDRNSLDRWSKHRGQLQDLSGPPAAPDDVYTRAEAMEYLEFCHAIIDKCVDTMDLSAGDCGFPWYNLGKLEHQINNIRHIQHHAGQLGDRLRSATGKGLDWTMGPA
ncbi:MAG: hypothetical protein PHU85_03340 [Phycisphaerae bacterium]|nr:hypothetical protein [Phycisphaerae bacterium]